jgi:hypothetical protein
MDFLTLPYESPEIDQVSAALVACQGALRPAPKDASNPAFKTRYADLPSVMEAIREPMLANGLAIQHQQLPGEPGRLYLRTVLRHKSGQFLACVGVFPLSKQDAQGMGSALTYARRYGTTAMLGVVQDDDDGNAASSPAARPEPAKAEPPAPPAATKAQIDAIGEALSETGMKQADAQKLMAARYGGKTGRAQLTQAEAADLLKHLHGLMAAGEV